MISDKTNFQEFLFFRGHMAEGGLLVKFDGKECLCFNMGLHKNERVCCKGAKLDV